MVWAKLLTRCGDSYFYAGSNLDKVGFRANGPPTLIEYRGVTMRPVTVRVTEAERLNGLTDHARLSMIATVYREKGEAWQDGPALRPRDLEDETSQFVQNMGNDEGQLGNGGAIVLHLRRIAGTWRVARGSTYFSTQESADFELGQLRVAKYNCRTGTVTPMPPAPPAPPTAAELAAKKAAQEAAAAQAAEDAANRKRDEEAAQLLRQQDAEIDATAERERRRLDPLEAPWRFSGPLSEFRQKLVANLKRRAAEFGFDASSFAPEIDQLVDLVGRCTRITKAEYDGSKTEWGVHVLERIRPGLEKCDGRLVRISGQRSDAKISIRGNVGSLIDDNPNDPRDFKSKHMELSDHFHIDVFLFPQDQRKVQKPLYMADLMWRVGVISADLPMSPAGS